MPGSLMWGWDADNKEWKPLKVDSNGSIQIACTVDYLNDIGDVEVPTPGDQYFVYWDAATSLWKCRALVDADIPAAIARDAEVATAVSNHTALPSAHHVKYTNAEAKAAAVLAGAITDGETKAPTHDAVFDVKTTADAAQTEAEVAAAIDTDIATHTALPSAHHVKYTDAEAKAAAVLAGAITDTETKAPTHDAVYDVKVTADGAIAKSLLTERGSVIFRNASAPAELLHGTVGQVLQSGGHGADPSWLTPASNVITITFIIDGGGSAITTNQKGHLEIPFACTITGWTLLADQSGSIVIDVWKDTYANFPPTVADTIAGSEKPTLAAAQKNQDLDLTTWTAAVAAGDILAFNVDSVATVTRVTLSIRATKS